MEPRVADARFSQQVAPAEVAGGYQLIGPDATANQLTYVASNILTDGAREYPVVDGIPFLVAASTRPGLENIRERACAHLRNGDERAALRLLLRNQDRFSPTPPPSDTAIDQLLEARDTVSLRQAMALLNYGAVADYFAHRWTSPTFQSGLALLERAANPERPILEVACGIGHFLRHLEGEGYATVGVDIVYSKLWLARHFLGVQGTLVCANIEQSQVLHPGNSVPQAALPHTVFCHDAFYFFEHKRKALLNMTAAANHGTLAVGHVHTRGDAHEAGFAERLTDYQSMLPEMVEVLDDLALARGYAARNAQKQLATNSSTAVAWIAGDITHDSHPPKPVRSRLRVNPLLTEKGIAWPSTGWRREYEADAEGQGTYAFSAFAKTPPIQALISGGAGAIATLSDEDALLYTRSRVLLDLPNRW